MSSVYCVSEIGPPHWLPDCVAMRGFMYFMHACNKLSQLFQTVPKQPQMNRQLSSNYPPSSENQKLPWLGAHLCADWTAAEGHSCEAARLIRRRGHRCRVGRLFVLDRLSGKQYSRTEESGGNAAEERRGLAWSLFRFVHCKQPRESFGRVSPHG